MHVDEDFLSRKCCLPARALVADVELDASIPCVGTRKPSVSIPPAAVGSAPAAATCVIGDAARAAQEARPSKIWRFIDVLCIVISRPPERRARFEPLCNRNINAGT